MIIFSVLNIWEK